MFDTLWSDPESNADIRWRGEEDQQKATAWSMIEAYFQQTPIPKGEKPQGVEVAIEADLIHRGLTKLVGIIDLVRPGGRIVDFKPHPSPQPRTNISSERAATDLLRTSLSGGHGAEGVRL